MEKEVEENEYLEEMWTLEDLAEKKARIYARLLLHTEFAKKMEALACSHEEKKAKIEKLLLGESKKGRKGE